VILSEGIEDRLSPRKSRVNHRKIRAFSGMALRAAIAGPRSIRTCASVMDSCEMGDIT
jgi:hypothetical protein